MNPDKIYPRTNDTETVYLKNVITKPNIYVGEYTIYNDFVHDPRDFERNNVLYQYPVNKDQLIIGKFCSIACIKWRPPVWLCYNRCGGMRCADSIIPAFSVL